MYGVARTMKTYMNGLKKAKDKKEYVKTNQLPIPRYLNSIYMIKAGLAGEVVVEPDDWMVKAVLFMKSHRPLTEEDTKTVFAYLEKAYDVTFKHCSLYSELFRANFVLMSFMDIMMNILEISAVPHKVFYDMYDIFITNMLDSEYAKHKSYYLAKYYIFRYFATNNKSDLRDAIENAIENFDETTTPRGYFDIICMLAKHRRIEQLKLFAESSARQVKTIVELFSRTTSLYLLRTGIICNVPDLVNLFVPRVVNLTRKLRCECAICFDSKRERMVKCSDCFNVIGCRTCISKWVMKTPTCTLCRADLIK